jgi:peroxiredoxin
VLQSPEAVGEQPEKREESEYNQSRYSPQTFLRTLFLMLRNLSFPPAFTLPDDNNQTCSLDELRADKPLVLLFFRGAFCATARRDLLRYADIYERLRCTGAELAAISVDTPDELQRLRETLTLPFPLLSDTDFAVSHSYGIYVSDEIEAGPQPHGEPGTFVLDVEGRLIFSQVQSGPKGVAPPDEVLLMLLYMQNKLSQPERHRVEKMLLQNDFEGEAMEGLEQVKDQQSVRTVVEGLNRELKNKTARKKRKNRRRELKEDPWLWTALLILLLLVFLSFAIIYNQLQRG